MVLQVMVGWWLLFSLVVSAAYRSSLTACFTVQGLSTPVDSFEDLVERTSWTWGFQHSYFTGVLPTFFGKSTNPVMMEVYDKMNASCNGQALFKIDFTVCVCGCILKAKPIFPFLNF